ncbi:MAG TPA: DUF998 domain-containing protein [Thermoplasmata archaeon]|jgi:hypothetical membrane protein|nr:DUF998 domain-containing protein [Thermoplasmata archaeon]
MSGSVRPFVPGSVRFGAWAIGVGVVQFVVAMAVVQSRYPGYSLLTNYISDLGNTATSPWHAVFNGSIMLLGALAFVGILAAWGGFPAGGSRLAGLGLLLLASLSAILVGVFPENVNPTVHGIVSLTVFAPGGVGLVLAGAGMRPTTHWSGYGGASMLLGLITLASLAYYVPTQFANSTFDPGLIERLIVAPILLWALLVAVHLGRLPVRPRIRRPRTG